MLLAITGVSLITRGLVLGIDFAGGVAWDVPAGDLTVDEAAAILEDNGLSASSAKIQERSSDSGDLIKIQVEDQPTDVRVRLQEAFAEAAGVDPGEVSVESVSASWGEEITRKAVIALVVFLALIALYISFRFEWRMAVTAIIAMLHDVAISVGIYSVFGFEVTPATVVAFLTVLGYSLYDSIVVFDRIRENERRLAASGLTAGDLVNVSTNQVLLRSINTTISAALPVLSLLVVGAGMLRADHAARVRHRPPCRHDHGRLLVAVRRRAAARPAQGAVAGVRRRQAGRSPRTSSASRCGRWSSPVAARRPRRRRRRRRPPGTGSGPDADAVAGAGAGAGVPGGSRLPAAQPSAAPAQEEASIAAPRPPGILGT